MKTHTVCQIALGEVPDVVAKAIHANRLVVAEAGWKYELLTEPLDVSCVHDYRRRQSELMRMAWCALNPDGIYLDWDCLLSPDGVEYLTQQDGGPILFAARGSHRSIPSTSTIVVNGHTDLMRQMYNLGRKYQTCCSEKAVSRLARRMQWWLLPACAVVHFGYTTNQGSGYENPETPESCLGLEGDKTGGGK